MAGAKKPTFASEMARNRAKRKKKRKSPKAKVSKVMHEYKAGKLHSGSKTGPVVKSRKQAIAIAMNS